MYLKLVAGLLSTSLAAAWAQTPVPLTATVATEAARCDSIAATTICLKFTAPAQAGTEGLLEPGAAQLRISGPDGAAITVQQSVVSPIGRQWLELRRIGETESSASISGVLPLDVEVFVNSAVLSEIQAGRFVALLTATMVGAPAFKVPVQLTVVAETDSIRPEPDFVPELSVTASPSAAPLRYSISVGRTAIEPPLQVSVTPETSDGGNWLSADLRFGASTCADQPLPCSFDAVINPPQTPGEYWGVLVITGEGLADRVTVRVKVSAALKLDPVSVEPRHVSLSAPLGSTQALFANVTFKGGREGIQYRATYSDSWLSVDPPVGAWPGAFRVVMSPYGLAAGVYADHIVLRAYDTGEVIATIPMRFNIIAPAYAPSVLDGGGWRTRFILVNPSLKEARATLRFWSNGAPWLMGVDGKGLTTKVENEVIPPSGVRVIETQGAQSRTQQGWAELVADGPVSMQAVIAEDKQVTKWMPVDSTVPLMNPYRDQLLLPFDNTAGGSVLASLANADDDPVTVHVCVLNENGSEIAKEGKFTLAPREGGTYVLAEKWPSSLGRRGVVQLTYEGGRLFALGLRSSGKSFYSYPAVAAAEMGLERALPHVNAGGAWQSTAYLANTSSVGQLGLLRLWPDATRFAGQSLSAESAPVVPGNGVLVWQAPCKDLSRAGGGWLESRYTKQVSGFMLLHQSYTGSPPGSTVERYESALSGQLGFRGRVAIPYDNRGSNSTAIVLVNPTDTPTDVQTIIYDLAGRFPRFSEAFRIPAKGQFVVNSAERWELGLPQGILEFSSRQGVLLTGVGLRYGDGAMAILPAYEK